MAPKKLNNFFEGRRRKASLKSYTHLKNGAGESRMKLELSLPILGESFVGLNTEISEPFTVMAKDGSTMGRTPIDVELDGMTVEFFTTSDTQSSKTPNVSSTGYKLKKFALVPEGEGPKRTIDLHLVLYGPYSMQLRDWASEALHGEFGVEAVQAQGQLVEEDEEEAEEEVERDEEEAELSIN